ncbi:MAG TPA: hypothetical protein VFZ34_02960, partial [Blastocatellia bacterium]|nr:hypothetical protein [Blastocatellia bacterium]
MHLDLQQFGIASGRKGKACFPARANSRFGLSVCAVIKTLRLLPSARNADFIHAKLQPNIRAQGISARTPFRVNGMRRGFRLVIVERGLARWNGGKP